ncbi:Nucleoside-diphosphate-sugar epimerase [Actinacidiphila yanglinensis]|uniref:Nucleoside-diphosphate-sugar epimerase n=1 Tax=Actinacidiphila yanglinensis TaxID=310779 RepID=A0A1H6A003_9ACTN|nr:SDR family oxidoreductase [Actinacidiphila yanglinensis]SEG42103.1 Nucleoside-diphosphate-sugar epimerase [Actinacidiphila yanglinensis]
MRVFVTGASGYIGSAVVPELIGAGHEVVGLARSDASAEALAAAGAQVRRGSLDDLESLRAGAAESDGVVHLAFIHDFSAFEKSVAADRNAIETIGAALEGSGRPLVIASGTLAIPAPGGTAPAEGDGPASAAGPRAVNARIALGLAERGVRASAVGLPPTVHGEGDKAFVTRLIATAREKGVSGYIGDGSQRWGAVHRLDAARLFRLAVEKAPAGTPLQGQAEEGVPTREIAEVIGRRLDVPVVSVPAEDAVAHFGWIGNIFGLDVSASNAATRELLGWEPSEPGLLDDLEQGHYFA